MGSGSFFFWGKEGVLEGSGVGGILLVPSS